MANKLQCATGMERLILGQELSEDDINGIKDYILSGGLRLFNGAPELAELKSLSSEEARQVLAGVFRKAVLNYFRVVGG